MDIRAVAIGLAFAFIWSSAFTSSRMIVADASPLAALTVRFILAGVIGVAVARAMGQTWNLTRAQWRTVIIFGVFQNGAYLGANFVAMQYVEASFASIVASTMPLMVAFAGAVFLRERLGALAIVGLAVGFAGVALIMGTRLSGGVDLYGLLLCVIGAVALTVATLVVRVGAGGGNVFMIVSLQMFVGAIVLGTLSAATETIRFTPTPIWWFAFIYTVIFPGLVATWLWFRLVDRIGTVRAATYHFLTPFFGVAIAAITLGEELSLYDVIGVAVISLGIFTVQWAKRQNSDA